MKINKKIFTDYLISQRYLKPHTVTQHVCNLHLIEKYFKDKEYTLENARKYVSDLLSKRKAGTVQGHIFTLRVICDFLIEKGELKKNFAKQIDCPKREKVTHEPLSVEEINSILSQALHHGLYRNRRFFWWLYFSLLAKTGAREMEIASLKKEDIFLDKKTILIRFTKTGQPREIPIPSDLLKPLTEHIEDTKSDMLFTSYMNHKNKPVDGGSIREQLRLYAKKAGIKKKVYPHLLRHSYITNAIANNIDLSKLQRLVGHTDLKSTAHYTHLVIDDLRDAVDSHPMNNKIKKESIEIRLSRIEHLLQKLTTKVLC